MNSRPSYDSETSRWWILSSFVFLDTTSASLWKEQVAMITSLLAIKVVAAVVILVVGVVGGVIPLLAARHHASRRFLSLGNSLAGGIFLGAGFIHLLPEAGAALGEVIEYPLAPLLAAIGVCVLLLIDRVLFETTRAGGGGTHQPIYPLVLLVVLSIHSIIAGIALGLEAEVAASVVVMLAILFHKGSAAFALMVSVHASRRRHETPMDGLDDLCRDDAIGNRARHGGLERSRGPNRDADRGELQTRWLRELSFTWPFWMSSMQRCPESTIVSRILYGAR